MLDPLAFEAYFAARLAFVDQSRVRISTRDERWRVIVRMECARCWMEYAIDRDHGRMWTEVIATEAARRARLEWAILEERAEPREAFDMRKLVEHMSRVAAAVGRCDLVVRQAWGSELAMRLESMSVFVSPEVHRRLLARQRQLEREHRLGTWFRRSGVV